MGAENVPIVTSKVHKYNQRVIMHQHTKSILQELEEISRQRDQQSVIENRASNIINSAVNLIKLFENQYGAEAAEVLERKLMLAIKAKDETRLTNSLRKINEAKRRK